MINPKYSAEELCQLITLHNGEEVTDLKQVTKVSFSGGELLEFINSLPNNVNYEDIQQAVYQAVLEGKSATTVLEIKEIVSKAMREILT